MASFSKGARVDGYFYKDKDIPRCKTIPTHADLCGKPGKLIPTDWCYPLPVISSGGTCRSVENRKNSM